MRFPLSATNVRKMDTMASKCPTIVKCPDNLAVMFRNPFEEHFNIEVVPDNDVKMDNVRIDHIELPEQILRARF